MREKAFQQQIIDLAKLTGWEPYFVWRSDHSPSGWPDLVLLRPPRAIFAELKVGKNTLSPRQEMTLTLLRGCGFEVFEWRPECTDEIDAVLRREL